MWLAPQAWATARTDFAAPMRSAMSVQLPVVPGGDFAQSLPDAFLECRALDIQGQVEPDGRVFDEAHDLGHELLEPGVSADQTGVRELVLKIPYERVQVVAHENGADAFLTLGHEDGAHGALVDREANERALAAAAVVLGPACQAGRSMSRRNGCWS